AARKVAESAENKGIVIGGSGQGEAIAANKIRGVRCALYYGHNRQMIALSKEHNNANMLSLGARFLTEQEAKEAVLLWLSVPFSNQERHLRRIRKISGLEEKVK
ncbi:RpiB/LacA/LacB family sugar-phosphate isomerase, partial [Candidatus Woesearchaeota archaeon]|nr:RpiB/LacA/LacB family sugar-phosphate isomerase [Candidatus Woesearchaeota archaeon]